MDQRHQRRVTPFKRQDNQDTARLLELGRRVFAELEDCRLAWQENVDPLVLRQNLIPLSGRRPMLSRQAKERLRDCRQEGRPAVRVRRAATEGRPDLFGGGAASSLTGGRPDRGEPIELDQAARRT